MNKFKKIIKDISLKALKAVLLLFVKTVDGCKKLDLHKLVGGVCRLGEILVHFIYKVGLIVETTVIKAAKLSFKGFVAACRFIYSTGEDVIYFAKLGIKHAVKIIMMRTGFKPRTKDFTPTLEIRTQTNNVSITTP